MTTSLLKKKSVLILFLLNKCGFLIPDKYYLKVLFRVKMGYPLNLQEPKSFNEKLQWLKLYNRKSILTTLVDKCTVKDYVASLVGEKYVIPTLGIWDNPDEIDWEKLPSRFVLKTNHGGGSCGVVICRDASNFDRLSAIKKLKDSLKQDIYLDYREWPYKNIKKKILAETFLSTSSISNNNDLNDYKFFCFNGKVEFFKIDFDRFCGHRANYYNTNGELLEMGEESCPPDFSRVLQIPENLDEMIEVAEKIANGYPFMRVDLFNVDGKIYFGEITFFPAAGMGKFVPDYWDWKIGSLLDLNKIKSL